MQVLQLSDAEISALPPGQQEQVRQLVGPPKNSALLTMTQLLTYSMISHLIETTNTNVANVNK
jgi:hypothetical protein